VLARLLPGGDSQPEFVVSSAGINRSFTSLWAAATEAGQSRIYGGIHFQSDNQLGLSRGPLIADIVLSRCLPLLAPESGALSNVSDTTVRRVEIAGATFWTVAAALLGISIVIVLAKTK
jgi:hypothetical protein